MITLFLVIPHGALSLWEGRVGSFIFSHSAWRPLPLGGLGWAPLSLVIPHGAPSLWEGWGGLLLWVGVDSPFGWGRLPFGWEGGGGGLFFETFIKKYFFLSRAHGDFVKKLHLHHPPTHLGQNARSSVFITSFFISF
jgi:hypothetical protein